MQALNSPIIVRTPRKKKLTWCASDGGLESDEVHSVRCGMVGSVGSAGSARVKFMAINEYYHRKLDDFGEKSSPRLVDEGVDAGHEASHADGVQAVQVVQGAMASVSVSESVIVDGMAHDPIPAHQVNT